MRIHSRFLLVVAALVLVLGGCGPAVEPPAPTSAGSPVAPPAAISTLAPTDLAATAAPEPANVVQSYYTWYLGYAKAGKNPLADRAYRASPHLEAEFARDVDARVESFEDGGYDPFLCAQDLPERFAVEPGGATAPDLATVAVHAFYTGSTAPHDFTVRLMQREPQLPWKIVDVVCDHGPASELQDWPVFRDETHGWAVRYPPQWSVQDVELKQPDLEKPVVRVLGFTPPGWAEDYLPFLFEVSQATEAELWTRYPPLEQPQQQTIHGYPVTVDRQASGETFYFFHHPGQASVWVVVRDEIAGFPQRAQGNNILSGVLQRMLSTFEFTAP